MKINNLFNALLKVKNQLSGSIVRQNDVLLSLTKGFQADIQEDIDEALDSVVSSDLKTILMNGEVVRIAKSAESPLYTIKIIDQNSSQSTEVTLDITDLENFDINSPLAEGFATTYNDIINSLSYGEAINEVILNINNLFLNKPTYNLSEILSVIDSCQCPKTYDINQLKQMIINSVQDGELSNYAWAELLKHIMDDSYANLNEESTFSVQEEHFFALQSFISTVITVLNFTFSVILAFVTTIFHGLGIALSFIFDTMSNLFKSVFDTDYKINANATYPGITGTLRASTLPALYYVGNDYHTNDLIRIPNGPEDIYLFTQKDGEGNYKTYCQSQLILYYHPDRLLRFLHETVGYSYNSDQDYWYFGGYWKIGINPNNWIPNKALSPEEYAELYPDKSPLLTSEEILRCVTDAKFRKRTVLANIMMAYIHRIGGIQNQNYLDNVDHTGLDFYPWWGCSTYEGYDSHIYPDNANSMILIALGSALRFYSTAYPFPLNLAKWHNFLDGVPTATMTKWINQLVDWTNNNDDAEGKSNGSGIIQDGMSWMLTAPLPYTPDYAWPAIFTIQTSGHIMDPNYKISIVLNSSVEEICDVDFIPTENFIDLPSISTEQVIAAILLVAGTIAVATLAVKRLSASIKARKQRRQTKRVAQLNNLKKLYDENPDDKDIAKQYRKALSNYNYKASIFGWGSYDSSNGWVNSTADYSGNSDYNNIEVLNKILSRLGKKH